MTTRKELAERLLALANNDEDEWATIREAAAALLEADAEIAKGARAPVAWLLTDEHINDLQVSTVETLVRRAGAAHFCNVYLRINGKDELYEADWLKHLQRTAPPDLARVRAEVVAGALFDLMGYLTSSDERWVFSARDDAAPAVHALEQWAALRGLSLDNAKVREWQDAIRARGET